MATDINNDAGRNDFKDLNFKLSVISALMEEGHFVDEVSQIKEEFKDGAEDYLAIEQVMTYYASLVLSDELLATITTLQPDGGDLAYFYATTMWDGEDDQFDIHSIEGIERLVNLETFAPIAMISCPSAYNPQNTAEDGIDFTPLLGCPKLKKVDTAMARKGSPSDDVARILTARGVSLMNAQ
jgi:hypothetical protein